MPLALHVKKKILCSAKKVLSIGPNCKVEVCRRFFGFFFGKMFIFSKKKKKIWYFFWKKRASMRAKEFLIEGEACQPPSSLRRLQATPPLQTSLVRARVGAKTSAWVGALHTTKMCVMCVRVRTKIRAHWRFANFLMSYKLTFLIYYSKHSAQFFSFQFQKRRVTVNEGKSQLPGNFSAIFHLILHSTTNWRNLWSRPKTLSLPIN